MKRISTLEKERDSILATTKNDYEKPSRYKAAVKRLKYLNDCIKYLQSSPDKEFLVKEIQRLEKRIQLINDSFNAWVPVKDYENEKAKQTDYNKMHHVKDLKTHLKTLNYLLS
jgi:hypothetical protein